ncbi:uncharacterized protein NDAI_0E00720 [Naumovozyma dairenensis CBS 421]|uniref:Uncharacterized protein n=1 Tax=Naumovozyma dairenensis (strain ATCC 10597 / BCRC 20456 / CBS 421 / NBRC 0211 / NRRL Y-12639) TaxID=1071378 RepID=G0WAW8_NAUDC|nr:hypothetical protein NDAI_0E00720 [Naumovozyma dairenensis CBS 421]CCD24888.1 hypothetical protein NDAI_0E00720 [Naumovozyma dairenensis CBS 421]
MPLQLPGSDRIFALRGHSASATQQSRLTILTRQIHRWEDESISQIKNFFRLKVFRITLTHLIILSIWLCFLWNYTSVYGELYAVNTLIASMIMNTILFGISDTLAQSITCFLSETVDPIPQIVDDSARHLLHQFESPHDIESGYESDNLSVFNDYGLSPVSSLYEEELDEHNDDHINAIQSRPETDVFNFRRFFGFMFWGFFISNFQVPWYRFLNFFYTEDPTVVQVLERVLSDQLVYSPVQLYYFFMYSNYVIEKGNADTFKIKIRSIYISTLGCNYLLWPAVQFINFLLMPKKFQVPFSSSVGVLWNCFLSMRNANKSITHKLR